MGWIWLVRDEWMEVGEEGWPLTIDDWPWSIGNGRSSAIQTTSKLIRFCKKFFWSFIKKCELFRGNILSSFRKIKAINTFGQGPNGIPDKFLLFSVWLTYRTFSNIQWNRISSPLKLWCKWKYFFFGNLRVSKWTSSANSIASFHISSFSNLKGILLLF